MKTLPFFAFTRIVLFLSRFSYYRKKIVNMVDASQTTTTRRKSGGNHIKREGNEVSVGMALIIPDVIDAVNASERFDVLDDATGMTVGFIDFAKEFKYLGSIIHPTLTSDAAVDRRIKAATAAFGALKKVLSNKYLESKVKGQVYVSLCLSILLYGSEVWCLREDLFHRLRGFHRRCCRVMCRITRAHTIRHHVSSANLFEQLGLRPSDTFYHRRLFCVGRGTFRVCP
jgi:hypothetical protein